MRDASISARRELIDRFAKPDPVVGTLVLRRRADARTELEELRAVAVLTVLVARLEEQIAILEAEADQA